MLVLASSMRSLCNGYRKAPGLLMKITFLVQVLCLSLSVWVLGVVLGLSVLLGFSIERWGSPSLTYDILYYIYQAMNHRSMFLSNYIMYFLFYTRILNTCFFFGIKIGRQNKTSIKVKFIIIGMIFGNNGVMLYSQICPPSTKSFS